MPIVASNTTQVKQLKSKHHLQDNAIPVAHVQSKR